jgi:hypothetical protein
MSGKVLSPVSRKRRQSGTYLGERSVVAKALSLMGEVCGLTHLLRRGFVDDI